MTYYLDASVILPRFLRQSTSEAADRFFDRRDGKLFITEFGAAEVSSGISRLLRTGELIEARAREVLIQFDAFRGYRGNTVEMVTADFAVAHAYVRMYEHGLRTPDALHLAVAGRLQLRLVTLDKRLARSARALGADVEVPT